jgi:hypothetical protein
MNNMENCVETGLFEKSSFLIFFSVKLLDTSQGTPY